MAKKLLYILVGCILGTAAVFCLLYVTNFIVLEFNIRLYNSEAEQQRNFNVFLILWIIFVVSGGFLGFMKSRKIPK
jgi:succinate-acetate transporter protein